MPNLPLRYPLEDQGDYKGVIVFEAKQETYRTLATSAFEGVLEGFSNTGGGGATTELTRSQKDLLAGRDPAIITFEAPETEYLNRGSVVLYLPNNLVFSDKMNYGGDEGIGAGGVALSNALRSGASGIDAIKSAFSSVGAGLESLSDALFSGVTGSEAASLAAVKVATLKGGAVQGAVEGATGFSLNPNRRSLFKDVGLRTFSFNFILTPVSEREAQEVKDIITFFRHEMYPEEKVVGGVPVAFKYPSKFFISMRYNGKKVGTDILPCFLESLNATYNSSNQSYHADGTPQEINLTLTFREERTLSKADVLSQEGMTRYDRAASTNRGR